MIFKNGMSGIKNKSHFYKEIFVYGKIVLQSMTE